MKDNKSVERRVDRYLSRKFLLACSSLALGYSLLLMGISIGDWAILAGAVLGAYGGSNVLAKFVEVRSNNKRGNESGNHPD